MEKQKVDITVRGQTYTILTDEAPERVLALANALNAALDPIMESGRVTLTQGLILTALDFADQARTASASAGIVNSPSGNQANCHHGHPDGDRGLAMPGRG